LQSDLGRCERGEDETVRRLRIEAKQKRAEHAIQHGRAGRLQLVPGAREPFRVALKYSAMPPARSTSRASS